MNKGRELRIEEQASSYFGGSSSITTVGTREQYNVPIIISGGAVTERYYFQHISKITGYKLRVEPEYFGDESLYNKVFPKRMKGILENLPDAKIYCVFDLDIPSGQRGRQNLSNERKKYGQFLCDIQQWLQSGNAVLAYSKPSFEYWLLLHFKAFKDTNSIRCSNISSHIGNTPLKSCFRNKPIGKALKVKKSVEGDSWVKCLCSDGRLEHAILHGKESVEKMDNPKELLCTTNFSAVYRIFEEHPNHKN